MSSYTELTREQQERVDAFMKILTLNGVLAPMDELEYTFVEEQASSLVLACATIEKQTGGERGSHGRG